VDGIAKADASARADGPFRGKSTEMPLHEPFARQTEFSRSSPVKPSQGIFLTLTTSKLSNLSLAGFAPDVMKDISAANAFDSLPHQGKAGKTLALSRILPTISPRFWRGSFVILCPKQP